MAEPTPQSPNRRFFTSEASAVGVNVSAKEMLTRNQCYREAEAATHFFATGAATAALAFGAARAQSRSEPDLIAAEHSVRKAADAYYAAFRLHYLALLEAAGLPPDTPKSRELDSPTAAE